MGRQQLDHRWFTVDGAPVHVRVSRQPPPAAAPTVVMVHGLGVASTYFLPTAELLAPSYRVYLPDLPGFGESGKPAKVLTIPELADALVAWLHAAGLERVVLLGNSMGCQTVVDAAVRHPAVAERTILVGPTTDPRAHAAVTQIWRWLRNMPSERLSQLPISLRDYRHCGVRRFLRTFQYALQDHIETKLPHLRAPTLVVRGSRDPIVPQDWAEEATRLLPRGQLVVIPGAAHTVNYNAPGPLARAVRSYLREQHAAGAGGQIA
jgi:pimeloyl-ACP methyl ester carboxylesterase